MNIEDNDLCKKCSVIIIFIGILFIMTAYMNKSIIEFLQTDISLFGVILTGSNKIKILACESLCCYWIGSVVTLAGIGCLINAMRFKRNEIDK